MVDFVTPSTCGGAGRPPAFAGPHRRPLCRSLCGIAGILLLVTALFFTTAPAALAATGEDIVATAEQYLGYPYGYQCAGPNAFDCGGFVWYVYHQTGVDFTLRINSMDLSMNNIAVLNAEELAPGDILFFGSSPFNIYHWGIYAGDGLVIHSYNEGTGVVYTPLDEVWPRFCYGCRLNALDGGNETDAEFVTIGSVELPWQSGGELPGDLRNNGEGQKVESEEVLQTLLRTCELLTGAPSARLLALADISAADLSAIWEGQPLALAGRILNMAASLSDGMSREEAIQLLLTSLLVPPESGDIWYAETVGIAPPPEPYTSGLQNASRPHKAENQIAASLQSPYVNGAAILPCERKQANLALQLTYYLLRDIPLQADLAGNNPSPAG